MIYRRQGSSILPSLPFLSHRLESGQETLDNFDLFERLGFPEPKFQLGDGVAARQGHRVKHCYINDDELDTENYGQLITNYGIILWMIPDVKAKLWEFFVLFDDESLDHYEFYPSSSPQFNWEDYLEFA